MSTKKLNSISILSCLILMLAIMNSNSSGFNTNALIVLDYEFNSDFTVNSTYEWVIQKAEYTSFPYDFPFSKGDIVSVTLPRSMTDYTYHGEYSPITFYYNYSDYRVLYNGEDTMEGYEFVIQSGLSCYGASSYQVFFEMNDPWNLNRLEPILFYPLNYINDSIIVPYFDMLYNHLSAKAIEIENSQGDDVSISITKDSTYLQIEFTQLEEESNYDLISKQIISINIIEGLLGFYRLEFEYTDHVDSAENIKFNVEMFSESFGPSVYHIGHNSIEIIVVSMLGIVCMVCYRKKKRGI
ncbi:MAG: hypothetical protein GOP50_07260 [Candidatus Heimdallarchaeota archaeon]|nr:hypothetical protein [Candidatus Heimdallarchaeota archaeon]